MGGDFVFSCGSTQGQIIPVTDTLFITTRMSPPSQIVFLDRGTVTVPMRPPALPLQWQEHESTAPEQIVERLQHAEMAISNKVPLMAATLAQLPRLRLIAVAATGTNNVDLEYCRERGIAVLIHGDAAFAGEGARLRRCRDECRGLLAVHVPYQRDIRGPVLPEHVHDLASHHAPVPGDKDL